MNETICTSPESKHSTSTVSVFLAFLACLSVCLWPYPDAGARGLFPVILAQSTLSLKHVIFDDKLQNNWSDGSVKCKLNPEYDEWIPNGAYALGATLEKGGALVFDRGIAMDIRGYSGITGQISGGKRGKQLVGICVIDFWGKYLPNKTGLDLRKYTRNGALPADDWTTFAVPFKDFGPLPRGIRAICFTNASGKAIDTFYMDDFGLTTAAMKSHTVGKDTRTTKGGNSGRPRKRGPVKVSYVFKDKAENGWQYTWSWGASLKPKLIAPGKAVLVARQEPFGGCACGRKKPFSTRGYGRLVFSINGGGRDDQKLRVVLFDKAGKEIREGSVNLEEGNFIEGGSISEDKWTTVSIPLKSLKGMNRNITKIAIINNSTGIQQFLIANVRFTE